jgi:hypothetical protein
MKYSSARPNPVMVKEWLKLLVKMLDKANPEKAEKKNG